MFITGRTRKLQSPYMFSGVLTSYFTDLRGETDPILHKPIR